MYNIELLNLITGQSHTYTIDALNYLCVSKSGTGGHTYNLDALNELAVLVGGTGGHTYNIDALNNIITALGGTGGHIYENDAWNEIYIGNLLNPSVTYSLTLKFDTKDNADAMVGDSASVASWNTFFDLPTNGTEFDNISLSGTAPCVIELFGGADIVLKAGLFSSVAQFASLLEISDTLGSIVELQYEEIDVAEYYQESSPFYYYYYDNNTEEEIEQSCTGLVSVRMDGLLTTGAITFKNCAALTTGIFTLVTSFGGYGSNFSGCIALTTLTIPSCDMFGESAEEASAFNNITGNTITITIKHALELHASIVQLKSDNTVTVNYSDEAPTNPQLVSAETGEIDGLFYVKIFTTKEIDGTIWNDHIGDVTIKINGSYATVDSVELLPAPDFGMWYFVTETILSTDVITITIIEGNIKSTDGGTLEGVTDFPVTNNVTA